MDVLDLAILVNTCRKPESDMLLTQEMCPGRLGTVVNDHSLTQCAPLLLIGHTCEWSKFLTQCTPSLLLLGKMVTSECWNSECLEMLVAIHD